MGRKIAVPWHVLFSVGAGVLYFFFVLPRWPELTGDTSHTLGNALRIVTGALIGLAALPVVFTLLRTRKPELGTPQLALSIRVWSIVAHVLAGVLIIGTAISEFWLTLDGAGQWLFGIYGAAAAIALIGFFAFYLSFVAELPPPPPKPIKPRKPKKVKKRGFGRKRTAESDGETDGTDEEETDETDETEAEADEPDETEEAAQTEEAEEPETVVAKTAEASKASESAESTEAEPDEDAGRLRNRRPAGKGSHRMRRRRGGLATDEAADEALDDK